jgi:hypothetical protein
MATEINPFGSIATMLEQFKMPGVINPFGNMATMLGQFGIPGLDMGSMVEAQRKNVEALVARRYSLTVSVARMMD